MNAHLFLIGFMGAGKTTVAQQLSLMTGVQYVDTDLSIEQSSKATIKNIFSQHGEQTFRELENSCLRAISQSCIPTIVSAGGGMPCHDGNIELMRNAGLVVYIRLTVETLCARLQNEVSLRPLLSNYATPMLFERIRELLIARESYYERAHFSIEADNLSVNQLAVQILNLLD